MHVVFCPRVPSELFINASDTSLQGLSTRANGALQALTPAVIRNDVKPWRLHVMEEGPGGVGLGDLRHRVIAGSTLKVAVGYPDLGPSAGTFKLSLAGDDSNLTVLAYNITAAALETAMNSNAEVAAQGSVDVTGTAPQFIVTFRTFGDKTQFVGDGVNLEPSTVVSIQTTQAGAAAIHEEQVIRLLRRPYAYSDNWTIVSDPTAATATQTVVGTSTTKGVVDLTIPENAESGSFRLEFTRAQVWKITAKRNTNAVAQRIYLEVGTPGAIGDYGGVFFDIEDKDGPVRVWLDYNNTSVAPAIPDGGRRLEVDYNSAVASVILAAIKAKFVADAQFSGTQSFELTKILIVQTTAGTRVAPQPTVVGASAGATITMSVERAGANGDLAAKYFPMADNAGTLAVWFNVHNDVEPAHGANRSIEVDASGFTTATAAATTIAAALAADASFTGATSSTVYVNATDQVAGTRTPGTTNTAGLPVAVVTSGVGVNGEFPHDTNAADLDFAFGTFWTITATKPRQFRLVSKQNGTWAAPSIASNFVVPTYFDGTLTLATTTLMAAFAATTEETLDAFLEVEHTTASAVETILRMPVVIHRDVLDQATIAPTTLATWLVNGEKIPIPAGTVALPGAYIIGDTDTGIYQIAADEMGITVGGVNAAEIGGTEIHFSTGGARRLGLTNTNVTSTVGLKSSHATAGIGYATGAGGTVTQATDKATGVTLDKATGAITMNGASLAAGATVSFVVTNSAVASTDLPTAAHASVGTAGTYQVWISAVASGSFTISVKNNTGGALAEAIVLRFSLGKSVNT